MRAGAVPGWPGAGPIRPGAGPHHTVDSSKISSRRTFRERIGIQETPPTSLVFKGAKNERRMRKSTLNGANRLDAQTASARFCAAAASRCRIRGACAPVVCCGGVRFAGKAPNTPHRLRDLSGENMFLQRRHLQAH